MKGAKINLTALKTIKSYAAMQEVTPSYIYKLIKEEKMKLFEIDGVQFIQTDIYKELPITNRRKRS
jgi:hypothetical protein